jgi:hypothetical protein
MSPIPIPDASDWSGRDVPFSSAEQKAALEAGTPFYIFDSQTEFAGPPPAGEKAQIAYLCQLLDAQQRLAGSPFVFTRHESPTRRKLAELAQRAAADDDVVGPCQIQLIPSTDPARKPFWFVAGYRPDDSQPAREPVRARASRAAEQEADPDDVPF